MTVQESDLVVENLVAVTNESPQRRTGAEAARRAAQFLRAAPQTFIYVGLLIVVAGIVLVAVAWGRAAGLTAVSLQIPYVLSAGFTGVALVVVGLAVVNAAVHQRDSAARRKRMEELHRSLEDLRRLLEEER